MSRKDDSELTERQSDVLGALWHERRGYSWAHPGLVERHVGKCAPSLDFLHSYGLLDRAMLRLLHGELWVYRIKECKAVPIRAYLEATGRLGLPGTEWRPKMRKRQQRRATR